MKTVKIGKRHQVTIPREIFEELHLEEGDILEAEPKGGKIVLKPKRLVDKAPTPKLSSKEQQALVRTKKKIADINKDLIHSKGLSTAEVEVAVKVGIIDPDQAYWWHEDWQKGERKAEEDIKKGRLAGPFTNADELLNSLRAK